MKKQIEMAVTHDGKFHADDVMAAVILTLVYPGIRIERSRHPAVIERADIAFDVGGGQYDHHQKGGNGERRCNNSAFGVPYSSAGLIWRDFGMAAISAIIATQPELENVGIPTAFIWDAIDENIIAKIDLIDNGIGNSASPSFSSMISSMNSAWYLVDPDAEDKAFNEAMKVTKAMLLGAINGEIGKVLAEDTVRGAFRAASHLGIKYLVLGVGLPWMEVLEKIDVDRQILFVVYPTNNGVKWQVRAVPKKAGSFGNLKDLPASWAGLKGEEFVKVTGVEGADFCHNGRFIAGAKGREGAIALAMLALRSL